MDPLFEGGTVPVEQQLVTVAPGAKSHGVDSTLRLC